MPNPARASSRPNSQAICVKSGFGPRRAPQNTQTRLMEVAAGRSAKQRLNMDGLVISKGTSGIAFAGDGAGWRRRRIHLGERLAAPDRSVASSNAYENSLNTPSIVIRARPPTLL